LAVAEGTEHEKATSVPIGPDVIRSRLLERKIKAPQEVCGYGGEGLKMP
jgi:hypothetical protein